MNYNETMTFLEESYDEDDIMSSYEHYGDDIAFVNICREIALDWELPTPPNREAIEDFVTLILQ